MCDAQHTTRFDIRNQYQRVQTTRATSAPIFNGTEYAFTGSAHRFAKRADIPRVLRHHLRLCSTRPTQLRHTQSSSRKTRYGLWPSAVILTPKVRPTELSVVTLNLPLTLLPFQTSDSTSTMQSSFIKISSIALWIGSHCAPHSGVAGSPSDYDEANFTARQSTPHQTQLTTMHTGQNSWCFFDSYCSKIRKGCR